MEKSIVFFDIDGTLLEDYSYVPQSTYEAVRKLRENGHYAFLCSGRSRGFVNNPLILDMGFDGIICACGLHVEMGEKMIFEEFVPDDIMRLTVDTVREYGFRPILEGPEGLYLDECDFGMDDPYGQRLRMDKTCKLMGLTENYGKWKANKLSCATEVPLAVRDECFEKLSPYYEYMIHNDYVVEMVPKGHDKGTGLAKACEYLGIPLERTYAFGDSVNDIGMFEAAGTAICMGGGAPQAIEAADYVTASLREDGVYKGLEHFGLI